MKISRREAITISGMAVAGLSLGGLKSEELLAQAPAQAPTPAPAQAPWPDKLVEVEIRKLPPLSLKPDGSAPEYSPQEAGTIEGGTTPGSETIWRYTKNQPPQIEFDYRKMRIKVDPRGQARLSGTLAFADLDALPHHSYVVLLQCGAPNPRGIVKWTGVRFADFAKMVGVTPFAHYCRIIASDRFWVEEDMKTMMHPQVMLAWLLNDEPIPPKHGAPLRLIIPFRYGARNLKAIQEIYFSTTSFPSPPLPAA